MRTIAELTLGSEPDAVPRARRLVRSALAGGSPELAADAELVVSELVTNAALHGEPPIQVRVLTDRVVRLEVVDAGRAVPIPLHPGHGSMTGGGLSMVSAIATSWGVDSLETLGKVVWAELDPLSTAPAPPPEDLGALLASWTDDDPDTEVYPVRLGPVSTRLLIEAKA